MKIYRLHYRAQLNTEYDEEKLDGSIRQCRENISRLQAEGRVLTAALYRHERMLFLYYEALGEPLAVVEPAAAHAAKSTCAAENVCTAKTADTAEVLLESGEDVQSTCVHPEEFAAPLGGFLMSWPGQHKDRKWVYMYHIYYHDRPTDISSWKRASVPGERRGRIAFLRSDKLFSYTYYHQALVDEGLLTGDRYQSIALHENILFSYFEEPKTMQNIRHDLTQPSKVIEEWLTADPESHFIHMPQGEGENFMLLPALFAMGLEENDE